MEPLGNYTPKTLLDYESPRNGTVQREFPASAPPFGCSLGRVAPTTGRTF